MARHRRFDLLIVIKFQFIEIWPKKSDGVQVILEEARHEMKPSEDGELMLR